MLNHSTPCYTEINSNFDLAAMDGETFLPVPDYEGHYSVSNYGRIIRRKGKRSCILKARRDSIGYVKVNLCRDGKQKTSLVHVLVAAAHIGPAPSDKPHVIHANDIPDDNRLINLRFGTSAENHRDPQANKAHCKYGHLYLAANTYVEAGGRRRCISCQRARAYVQYSKKIGRTFDFHADADRRYIELTTAPDADLTPVLSQSLAAA